MSMFFCILHDRLCDMDPNNVIFVEITMYLLCIMKSLSYENRSTILRVWWKENRSAILLSVRQTFPISRCVTTNRAEGRAVLLQLLRYELSLFLFSFYLLYNSAFILR